MDPSGYCHRKLFVLFIRSGTFSAPLLLAHLQNCTDPGPRSARFRFTSLRFRFRFSLSPLRSRSLLRFPSRNSRHFSFADPQSSLPLSASWLSDQALGRLVSPSFTRYRASTDDLSTWSSPRGLTRFRDGNSLLWVGFTLRCLQRLSSPHFASQLCRWHDNCCTRGASIPVLSY